MADEQQGEQKLETPPQGEQKTGEQQLDGKTETKETVSREYADRLRRERDEAQASARKLQEAQEERERKQLLEEKKFKEAYEASEKRVAELDAQWKEKHSKSEQRYMKAELKAHAASLGMRDIDDITLADLSAVKIDDDGNVTGAKEAIAALKERKPYLFASGEKREEKAPEGREQPPPGGKTEGKDAFSMSDAEFDLAFRKQFPRV